MGVDAVAMTVPVLRRLRPLCLLLCVVGTAAMHGVHELSQAEMLAPGDALKNPTFPTTFPFTRQHLSREDESADSHFYAHPRLVMHIDDGAITALRTHYSKLFPAEGAEVLDICSSWTSHYPKGWTGHRVCGLGMNKVELSKNPHLTEYTQHDLNKAPKLPYNNDSFDFVTNAVSVDYLVKPQQIFSEIKRVLKPGGTAVMAFSNRYFPTKVINIWQQTTDAGHIWIVGSYFHYAGFEGIEGLDISTSSGRSDPMYVIQARKPDKSNHGSEL